MIEGALLVVLLVAFCYLRWEAARSDDEWYEDWTRKRGKK